MLLTPLISALCLAASVIADPAPETHDSPTGVIYKASIKQAGIDGTIAFTAFAGLVFGYTRIDGLPATGSPFQYAIHQRPVPRGASCSASLGILDPYDGEINAPTEAEYRVGDLSGKHGAIRGRSTLDVYLDPYLSLNSQNPAFVGSLSAGVRDSSGRRLVCSNIQRAGADEKVPQEVMDQMKKLVAEYQHTNGTTPVN